MNGFDWIKDALASMKMNEYKWSAERALLRQRAPAFY